MKFPASSVFAVERFYILFRETRHNEHIVIYPIGCQCNIFTTSVSCYHEYFHLRKMLFSNNRIRVQNFYVEIRRNLYFSNQFMFDVHNYIRNVIIIIIFQYQILDSDISMVMFKTGHSLLGMQHLCITGN